MKFGKKILLTLSLGFFAMNFAAENPKLIGAVIGACGAIKILRNAEINMAALFPSIAGGLFFANRYHKSSHEWEFSKDTWTWGKTGAFIGTEGAIAMVTAAGTMITAYGITKIAGK